MEKLKKIFYKAILIVLFVLVIYVTYCSIFNIYKPTEELKPIIIILGIITLIFASISLRKVINRTSEKIINRISILILILFFILLLISGFNYCSTYQGYDITAIKQQAKSMIDDVGTFLNNAYFLSVPHQIPTTILIYFTFYLENLFKISNLNIIPTIVNSLFITITAMFTYLSVKELKGCKDALLTLVFFVINPIFYLYASYYYTTLLCIPFITISIYLIIKALKSKVNKKTILFLLGSGIIMAIGFKIKAIVGIVLIGAIIGLLLNENKNKKMKTIALILGFILGILIITIVVNSFNFQSDKNKKYPITHWIMLGLNENTNGAYSNDEEIYTSSRKTYIDKVNANIDMIISRLQKLGINGIIELQKQKLSQNWSNGDYYYVGYLNNIENINKSYEYIVGNKKIFLIYYLQICKSGILVILLIAIAKEIFKRDKEKIYSIIFISIFGAFLFHMIWEVKIIYSLSFLPLIILIFSIGITQIEKVLNIKQIDCKMEYKNGSIDLSKMNKTIAIITITISILLLMLNYYEYTIKEYSKWDKRAVQYYENGSLNEKISNKKIQQTFKVRKSFNCISIKLKKQEVKTVTHYEFKLKNINGKVLVLKKFTSDDVVNNKLKTFYFDKIKLNETGEYIIELSSIDATDENSLGIATFYLDNYSIYDNGKLTINGEETKADLIFQVVDISKKPYTSKKVYILLSIIIISIEIFAFYPYIKIKRRNRK